jgi:hypothetical protein
VRQDPSLLLNPANGPYFAEWGQDGWLDWSEGNIHSKNPSPALINKMAEIASRLEAVVQGDDGEHYPLTPAEQVTNRAGVSDTIRGLLRKVSARFKRIRSAPTPSFKVGDRVVDSWGKEATVIQIDLNAAHGLGKISVRYDDGRLLSSAAVAHGLSLVHSDLKT